VNNPDISVIVCTYNRIDSLLRVLQDLKKQIITEGSFAWELVIVDNNSTDGTKAVIENYRENEQLSVQYVFEPRQGKSFALNAGVQAARGEVLAFTDDDVILNEHWLSSIHIAVTRYPYNCFGGKVLPVLEDALPSWLSKDDRKYRIYGGPIVTHDRGNEIKKYDETMWVPIGSNMFIRKKLFEKYGHFDTRLGFYSKETLVYGEDSEIMFRFKKGGEAVLYYPEAVVHHPAPADRIKKSYFRRWHWGAGRGAARWMDFASGSVRYLNVPRYLIRQFLEDLVWWLIVLPGGKEYKKFYYEMQLLYKLGIIYEFYINGD
jgi:glucosyl-dolichyl phosphate glucuronosyltransferase